MEKTLKSKKLLALTKGLAGFTGILLVLFVIFSCNNILITSGGSLIISTPGARAASDSISYTIVVEGSQGSPQSKPLTSGSSVQFDNLAPDTYTISVEGRKEGDVLVYSGTKSATVTAGETSSVIVKLEKLLGSLTVDFSESVTSSATEFKVELNIGDTPFKREDISGVTSVQFDDLAPGAYNIVVEGMDASGAVVLYGTDSATVTAGETPPAKVNLLAVINSFEELQSAVATDCSLYIGSSFGVTETIVIEKNVNIMAMTNASLSSSVTIFQIDGGGKLTLAGELESKTLTLQTSGTGVSNIKINGGELVLEDGVSIIGENLDGCVFYGYSGSLGGTFYMNGGSITNEGASNSKGGIYISSIGTAIMSGGTISGKGNGVYLNGNSNFTMTGGTITGDSSGAYISNDSTFTISGDAVVNSINLPNTAAITVGGVLTGSTPVATITMASYTSRTAPVLKDAEGMNFVSTEYQKFAVGDTVYAVSPEGYLQKVASDFTSLKNAVASGGTVYIASNIDISETLQITAAVTLLSKTQNVVLKNTSSGNLFTVARGNLTIGDADHAITLDGNKTSSPIIYVDGGTVSLANGTITNANASGVYVNSGTFNMTGGSITDNTATDGGGVNIFSGTFKMSGGSIEANTATNGGGVYVNTGATFTMSGSAVVNEDNDVYLSSGTKILVSEPLSGDFPVATITPADYADVDVQVLESSSSGGDAFGSGAQLSADAISKFAVTPNSTDGTQWSINGAGFLQKVASDFASLRSAVASGGLVYIASNIDISETLEITTEVTLLSRTPSVVLTGPNSGNLFTVSSGGELTIGDTTHAITLDGNKKSSQIISVDDGGIVTLANGTITNANASGVCINAGGKFNMTGGSITGNATSNGGGVYVYTGATFTMSGSAIVNQNNDVYLSEGTTISVSGDLSGGDIVAKITPYTYETNTVDVVVLSGSSIGSNYGKFTVTSASDGDYQIVYDGASAKLGKLP